MKKQLDRDQADLWGQEQRNLRMNREVLKKELIDVENLTPDFFLECLELGERDNYKEPMSLAELFSGFDWTIAYEDMVPEQRRILWEKIYETLGIDINTKILDRYKWIGYEGAPGRGEVTITVSATRHGGLVLHHITYADGVVDIAIGRLPEK